MSREIAIQDIPKSLIYEMVDGKPIYYKGYVDVLKGNKQPEEIMGDSNIQALLKILLGTFLTNNLGKKYIITGGEHGLLFRKKSWRAADLAIFSVQNYEWTNKYSTKPPEVVIEIDTKADLESFDETINYFDEKTEQLLKFGVKKVIWIFTESEKVKIINTDDSRQTFHWSDNILVWEDCIMNIQKIIDDSPLKTK